MLYEVNIFQSFLNELNVPDKFLPSLSARFKFKFPLLPTNSFLLKTILIIPAIPSGSNFAEGVVITSTFSIMFAFNISTLN